MAKTSVPCEACQNPVYKADAFCEACGAAVSAATKERLAEAIRVARERRQVQADEEVAAAQKRKQKVKSAVNVILGLAVLFCLSGVVMYFLQKDTADKALVNIATMSASDTFPQPIEGKTYTVGELRAKIAAEPLQALAVNVAIGVIMLGLWIWGRKAPFPAIVAALASFVVVHFVSALVDPATIAQGIFLKVIAIAALVGGLKAVLADRAATARVAE